MLAWVGLLFALLLLTGCIVDALFGATAEALAQPAPIETLDGLLRAAEPANDEPATAWAADTDAPAAELVTVEESGMRHAA